VKAAIPVVLQLKMTSLAKFKRSSDLPPIIIFVDILIIAGISIILTLIIPAVIAYRHDVFYPEGLKHKLPQDAAKKLDEYEAKLSGLKKQLQKIDEHILNPNEDEQPEHRVQLLELRTKLASYVDGYAPPVSLFAFYLSPQMLLWPGIYTALGILIILCPPESWSWAWARMRKVAAYGTAVYCFYEWPLWVRNFVLGSHGRVVFAYPNYDIDPASFWAQEGTIFGFCLLLAALWLQWSHESGHCSQTLKIEEGDGFKYTIFSADAASRLTEQYSKWTYCSIILALGFLSFTNFFWSLVAKYHDQRYLLSAVLAHTLWGLSWIAISLPIWRLWIDWGRRRSKEMERAMLIKRAQENVLTESAGVSGNTDAHHVSADDLSKVLGESDPIKALNFGLANLTAAISFVLPLVQFFTK
jgi:hypothetical protein